MSHNLCPLYNYSHQTLLHATFFRDSMSNVKDENLTAGRQCGWSFFGNLSFTKSFPSQVVAHADSLLWDSSIEHDECTIFMAQENRYDPWRQRLMKREYISVVAAFGLEQRPGTRSKLKLACEMIQVSEWRAWSYRRWRLVAGGDREIYDMFKI